MSDVTISPNMSLPVPIVGIDVGPDWANNINSCLSILDQHNHSAGSGIAIMPGGLNINSALTFQNNQATNLQACAFTAQSAVSTLDSIYVKGVDLYYRDGSNNEIRITTGGAVNATSSGITSGTASASFVGAVLVVNAASTTPANIQCGSLLIGNNSAGSHYLTLQPPNAMGADYTLTLPSIPASQKIMTLDAVGNISAPYVLDNSTLQVSANVISIKDGGVTRPKLAPVGQQVSSSCGTFTTSSVIDVDVTNLTITITSTGRPIYLGLVPADTTGSFIEVNNTSGTQHEVTATITLYRGGAAVFVSELGISNPTDGVVSNRVPPGVIWFCDVPAAGTYSYKIATSIDLGSSFIEFANVRLFAYEIA